MTEYSFEDRISRSAEAKRQRAISRGIISTSVYNNEEKIIKSIIVGDDTYSNTLNSSGGNVRIKISGTADAMFSMTIVDTSGCDILRKEIKNVKVGAKGIYNFYQQFPSIQSVKDSKGKIPKEIYTITVTPSADTKFSNYIDANPYVVTIEQRVKSKITIAHYENGTTGLTFTAPAKSQTGEANQASNYQDYTDISFPIAVKYSSYSAGNIYVKSTDFNTNVINGKTGKSNTYEFGIDSNNDYVDGVVKDFVGKNFEERVKDTITVGSKASWKIEHEKFVTLSLDKDGNVLNFDNCKNNKTKIFKLNNTLDIFPNMQVIGDNIITSVASISACGEKVTLSDELVIQPHTVLTFINKGSAIVTQTGLDRKPDKKTITFNTSVNIPDRTVVTFDDDTSVVKGTITQAGSGNTGHGTVSAYNTTDDAFAYAPNNNFVGSDSFTFTMSDGTNTSDEKTVLIEVLEGASGTSDTLSGGGG